MVLRPEHRKKIDETDDLIFYEIPRFVTHVDAPFLQQLTELYREKLQPGMRVLDLMSSWVSHLPEDIKFDHVEGHGLNTAELGRNPQLDHYFVQDLNRNPKLPLLDRDFDAVLITASVQYLQYPEAIFAEIGRILKPQGIVIVSFSNRMFYQKAVQIWRDCSEPERVELVRQYLAAVPDLEQIQVLSKSATNRPWLQLLGLAGGDPFYAVWAQKRMTPLLEQN